MQVETYETLAPKKAGIFRLNDEQNIHVVFIGGMGVSRKLTKRLNLSLEHQVHVTDNDLLDGIQWRTDLDQTRQDDIQHYTNLRLGINLGRFKKRVEPLYWVNPLDAAYSDIAELKQRPKFDLTDTDQDGVMDMLDQETETPAGAPVDTWIQAFSTSDREALPVSGSKPRTFLIVFGLGAAFAIAFAFIIDGFKRGVKNTRRGETIHLEAAQTLKGDKNPTDVVKSPLRKSRQQTQKNRHEKNETKATNGIDDLSDVKTKL